MWPTSDCVNSARIRRTLIATFALFLPTFSAFAHTALVTHGELRADNDALIITLRFSDHDLRHFGLATTKPAEIRATLAAIANGFEVYDETGARIVAEEIGVTTPPIGAAAAATARHFRVQVRFVPSPATTALTIRLRAVERVRVANWHVVLKVPRDNLETAPGISLLADGGAAMLNWREMQREKGTAAASVLFEKPESLSLGRCEVSVNKNECSIRIEIPAPLLARLQLLKRDREDIVTSNDLATSAKDLRSWLEKNAALTIGNAPVELQFDPPALLAPFANQHAIPQANAIERMCFWSARIVVRAKLNFPAQSNPARFEWTGYSPGVLRFAGVFSRGNKVLLEDDLTAYASSIEWRRDESGLTIRVGQREKHFPSQRESVESR